MKKIIILVVVIFLAGLFLLLKGYYSVNQAIVTKINTNTALPLVANKTEENGQSFNNQNSSTPPTIGSIQTPIVEDNSQAKIKPPPGKLEQNQPPTQIQTKNTIVKKPLNKSLPSLELQIIKATITYDDGLSPNTFTLKVGVSVRLEIDPKDDGEGCMSTILIEGLYDEPSLVIAGKKIIMEFKPKELGTYYIACVMGVPWGEIKVVR